MREQSMLTGPPMLLCDMLTGEVKMVHWKTEVPYRDGQAKRKEGLDS